jgi:hypothetical protein
LTKILSSKKAVDKEAPWLKMMDQKAKMLTNKASQRKLQHTR